MNGPVVGGKVTVYTVEAKNRAETPYPHEEFQTLDYQEALAYAQEHKLMVIENIFEFDDSQMLDDFTEE